MHPGRQADMPAACAVGVRGEIPGRAASRGRARARPRKAKRACACARARACFRTAPLFSALAPARELTNAICRMRNFCPTSGRAAAEAQLRGARARAAAPAQFLAPFSGAFSGAESRGRRKYTQPLVYCRRPRVRGAENAPEHGPGHWLRVSRLFASPPVLPPVFLPVLPSAVC